MSAPQPSPGDEVQGPGCERTHGTVTSLGTFVRRLLPMTNAMISDVYPSASRALSYWLPTRPLCLPRIHILSCCYPHPFSTAFCLTSESWANKDLEFEMEAEKAAPGLNDSAETTTKGAATT